MSGTNKKRLKIAVVAMIFFLSYMLWPLGNSAYSIQFDMDKIDFRKSYLAHNQTKTPTDTQLPNVIIILADDLGLVDVGLYGGKNVDTKHIDAIGRNGVTFEEGYISSPTCAPSRAGLLTGRYQQRFGFEINLHDRYPKNRLEHFVYANILETGDWKLADKEERAVPLKEDMTKQGLPPSELTLPEVLKTKGYQTAAIGKWHLGDNTEAKPNKRGFDYHYGFYEAFSLYAPIDEENIVNQKLDDFSDPFIWEKGRQSKSALRRNDVIVEESEYLTQKIAKEANQWIDKHKENPFFLYIPFSAPHTPFQVTKDYYDKYAHVSSPKKRIYYAMIHALDDAVGSIMANLTDLGLEENTLVIFLSDNGGATYTEAADNSPLRGGKFSNFEGGLHIPFMMQWKRKIPKGIHYKNPVSALDIFATCTNVANVQLPDDRDYDGVNLLPYVMDPSYVDKVPHDILYWRAMYHKAVRMGSWKMIQDEKANQTVLFNLAKDKYEQTNVADEHPLKVKELRDSLAKWEEKLMPSAWPRVMDYETRTQGESFYFPL